MPSPGPGPTGSPAGSTRGTPAGSPASHPNLPRRGALALTFVAIVTCGVLGGGIGYGIVRTSCPTRPTVAEKLLETVPGFHAHTRSCTPALLGSALAGTAIAGVGAGIVAMLMLRAQSEWRAHPASRGPGGRVPAGRAPPLRTPRSGGRPPRT